MCVIPNDFADLEKLFENLERELDADIQADMKIELDDGYVIPKGFESLASVFQMAIEQAAKGKGKERHQDSEDQPFHEQDIVKELITFGGPEAAIFQARKKAKESLRFSDHTHTVPELLGAINYLAAAVIYHVLTNCQNCDKVKTCNLGFEV